MLKNLVDGLALVDAANAHRFPLIVMHQYDSRIARSVRLFDAEIPDLRVDLAFGVLDHRVLALRQRILRPDLVEPVVGELLGEDLQPVSRSSSFSFVTGTIVIRSTIRTPFSGVSLIMPKLSNSES